MRAVLAVLLLAGPAAAMSVEDCRGYGALAVEYLPLLEVFEVSDEVSDDGWCQIASGPSPVSEDIVWRVRTDATGFSVDLRLPMLRIPGRNGSGSASVYYHAPSQSLDMSRVHLTVDGESSITAEGVMRPVDFSTPAALQMGLGTAAVSGARMGVTGDGQFFAASLAEVFGLDINAARSNIAEGQGQRREMLAWLDRSLPGPLQSSWRGFREIVEDYPRNGAGTVEVSLRNGATVPVSTLAAMYFDLTKGRPPDPLGLSALSVTWSPG